MSAKAGAAGAGAAAAVCVTYMLYKLTLYSSSSGYILGRALLAQLVAPEVWALGGLSVGKGPTAASLDADHKFTGDAYRSSLQMAYLSVLADAVDQSYSKCPSREEEGKEGGDAGAGDPAAKPPLVMGQAVTGNSCIRSLVPRRRHTEKKHAHAHVAGGRGGGGGGAPLPEVDGDTLALKDWYWPLPSLLAEQAHKESPLSSDGTYPFDSMVTPINTRLCQHSDHAMGRCLLYGASGVPVGALCETRVPLESVPRTNEVCGLQPCIMHGSMSTPLNLL